MKAGIQAGIPIGPGQGGAVALAMVLLVLTLMAGAVLGASRLALLQLNLVADAGQGSRAEWAAVSGVQHVLAWAQGPGAVAFQGESLAWPESAQGLPVAGTGGCGQSFQVQAWRLGAVQQVGPGRWRLVEPVPALESEGARPESDPLWRIQVTGRCQGASQAGIQRSFVHQHELIAVHIRGETGPEAGLTVAGPELRILSWRRVR